MLVPLEEMQEFKYIRLNHHLNLKSKRIFPYGLIFNCFLLLFIFCMMLWTETRSLHTLITHFSTELHPQLYSDQSAAS